MLVNSVNAAIQLSQNSLNETFVVQLSTFIESVESSMTVPVMQCKKVCVRAKNCVLMINEYCMSIQCIVLQETMWFHYWLDINPLYSVEETSISPSSATLQCRLACMTENLQCIVTSFNPIGLQPATVMNVNKMSQEFLVLEGLQESTVYEYCVSAYDSDTNSHIGFSVCGMFKTAGKSWQIIDNTLHPPWN